MRSVILPRIYRSFTLNRAGVAQPVIPHAAKAKVATAAMIIVIIFFCFIIVVENVFGPIALRFVFPLSSCR